MNTPVTRGSARDRWGLVVSAAAAVSWFIVGYVRYRNNRAGASDLGIFDQASWLMASGRSPFITSIGIDVFADHVSPVLILFAPLYRIAATPAWLLGAQAACLGLTVVVLRKLADEAGVPRWVPTVATVFSAPLLSAAVYDVHPVVFATPAVAWALLASARGNLRHVTVAAALVACCRADAVTALLGVAVVSAPAIRRRLLWMAPLPLLVSVLVPHWLGTWQTFDRYYPRLGSGWPDAALHPWRIVVALASGGAWRQLLWWFLPVGFLPLLRPRWSAALVVAGLPLLLSSWPGIVVPWYHHTAFLVPIAVAAALHGWKRLSLERPADRRKVFARTLQTDDSAAPATRFSGRTGGLRRGRLGAMAGSVVLAVGLFTALAVASPAAPSAPDTVNLATVLHPTPPAVAEAIAAVGPHEGVSAQNAVLGHLGHRNDAYIWPCPFRRPAGRPSCHHRNLYQRAGRVDVIVLLAPQDNNELRRAGFTDISNRHGVVIARRPR